MAAAFALTVVCTFIFRRWNIIARRFGLILTGGGSMGLVIVATARLVIPAIGGSTTSAGIGLPITLVSGLIAFGFGIADFHNANSDQVIDMIHRVSGAVALIFGGFVALFIVTIPLGQLFSLADGPYMETLLRLTLAPLAEIGFVAVAVAWIFWTGRGMEWIDFERPSVVGVGLIVLGTVALLVLQISVVVFVQFFDLPNSSQGTMREAARDATQLGAPELVLVLVPMMLFVVAPAEELLFRNVIQKYLYEAFNRTSAVLVAGVVFAGAHVLAYGDPNHAAVFVSLASIFFISLVLGFLYEFTENLTITTVAHGLYNASLVVLLYVALLTNDGIAGMV